VALAYGLLAGGGLCARVAERVLDLSGAAGSLDELMARGPDGWTPPLEGPELDAPELAMPFTVADYVDFYSSLHHATNL
jgi:fumarylacetoacetase